MGLEVRQGGDGAVDPVHQQIGEVGQRVAERAQLPVQHGDHARLCWVNDHVVEPVVAMHHAGAVLGREGLGQPVDQLFHLRKMGGFRGLILLGPAVDLTAHIVAGLAVVAKADGLVVGIVQIGQGQDLGHEDRMPLGWLILR